MTFDECVAAGLVLEPIPKRTRDKVNYVCQDCKSTYSVSLGNVRRSINIHGYPRCNKCSRKAAHKAGWINKVRPHLAGNEPAKQSDVAEFFCRSCGNPYPSKVVNWLRSNSRRCFSCVNLDPERREKLSIAASAYERSPHSEVTKAKMSASAKATWDEGRQHTGHVIRDLHADPKWKADWLRKHLEADEQRVASRAKSMPEANEKRKNAMRRNWRDPAYRQRILQQFNKYLKVRKPSELEVLYAKCLKWLDIPFIREFEVGPYALDFYIPSHKLFVEIHGLKWHHPEITMRPDKLRTDKSKETYVKGRYPDHTYKVIWEDEFSSTSSFAKLFPVAVHDFSLSDVVIDKDPDRYETHDFLQLFHYAEKGRLASRRIAAYLHGVMIGVVEISGTVRKEVATSMGFEAQEVKEISRFCLNPRYQKKNLGSWLLARSLEFVQEAYPTVKAVVSFADETFGHSGTIYKAANFEFIGHVKPDYHYEKSGARMHKRTFYSLASRLSLKEKDAREILGYTKVWGKQKSKFVYTLKGKQ